MIATNKVLSQILFVLFTGVPRLDVPRGRKQVWRPYVRAQGILGVNLLYWRKYSRHC